MIRKKRNRQGFMGQAPQAEMERSADCAPRRSGRRGAAPRRYWRSAAASPSRAMRHNSTRRVFGSKSYYASSIGASHVELGAAKRLALG